jgi:hypothetical protein
VASFFDASSSYAILTSEPLAAEIVGRPRFNEGEMGQRTLNEIVCIVSGVSIIVIGVAGFFDQPLWRLCIPIGALFVISGLLHFIHVRGRRGKAEQSTSEPSDNEAKAAARRNMLADLGDFLERHSLNPTDIYDQALLPHPKEALLDAIFLEMSRSSDEREQSNLHNAAIMLAHFQPGVGPQPLSQLGVDLASSAHLTATDLAKTIARNPLKGRWQEFYDKVEEEIRSFEVKSAAALYLSRNMPPEQKRRVFGA